jgi:hypothetical protein
MNIRLAAIITLTFILNISRTNAQITRGQENRPLSCSFLKNEEIITEGQAVSNVLFVKNINGISREFYLEVTVPNGWKTMVSSERIYKLDPEDSIYIPIRITPNNLLMKGATKYSINVFVIGTDGRAHAMCSFFVGKLKKSAWDMAVLPRSRIYFLNDENRAPLSIFVANKGEEEQELNLSWKIMGRGLSLKTDSLKKNFLDFKLKEDKDTIINFIADIARPDLNFSRIDIESYRPDSDLEGRKYTVYFRAVEPFFRQPKGTKDKTPSGSESPKISGTSPQSGGTSKSATANLIKLNSSVDFVKLSNTALLNNYGAGIIPLTWNSNLINVLGVQPMWSNNFMLRFTPHKGAMLYGNLQHFFTYYSPGNATFQNLQGNLAYFSSKLDIILGQGTTLRDPLIMSVGGLNAVGRGFSAVYRPIKNISINSFYSQGPQLFSINPQFNSFGISVGYSSLSNNKFKASAGYVRTEFFQLATLQQNFIAGFYWRINKEHKIQASAGLTDRQDSLGLPSQSSRQALNWMARYSGSFFNKRLFQSFSGVSRTIFRPINGSVQTLFLNNRTAWRTKDFNFILSNSIINSINTINNNSYRLLQIPSNLSLGLAQKMKINLMPSIYHNFITDTLFRMHQIGLMLNNNYYDYNRNIRLALNFMGSYNFYTDTLNYRPIFNSNVFLMAGYKTFNSNIRYTYGPINFGGVRQFHLNPGRYPQYIFINLNKQHIFQKIRHFVFDFALNYSWNNITYAHNIALTPVVYFFTKNGWRFNASFFYNLNARNPELAQQFYTFQGIGIPLPEPEAGTQYASNFNLQFGLRKDFGIKLPKKMRKNFYTNPSFIAFLDFNGNKIKDNDEVALENMVIQLNGHEAITDKDGRCQFLNVEQQRYFYNVIPLIDLGGWFTLRSDSIDIGPQGVYYVPFTKGVKIEGTVLLDREKFTEDVLADLDLSKIRIFTTDTSGNSYSTLTDRQGNFSFYVPFGYYALSMDEEVLSDRFFVAQNNIPIELEEGLESYYQAFFIIEKRRKVKKKKFNDKGELIYTEEVENIEKKSSGNKKFKNRKDEDGLFNEERKNGGTTKDSTDNIRLNYDELDKRIQKLDSIINNIKERSLLSENSKPNQEFNRQILIDALKQLKEEEERNTPYYIVQVAIYPKGQQVPPDINNRLISGSLLTLDDRTGNTIYYFGEKFANSSKAMEAQSYAIRNKIGKPEIKVLFRNRILTLNEFKNTNR